MRVIRILTAAAVLAGGSLVLDAPAHAHDCASREVIPVGQFYIDVREDVPHHPTNVHLYEETNGITGLQKGGPGDEECAEPDGNGGFIPGDRYIR